MSFLSIRKLPPELDKAIKEEARKRNISKSRVVIDALKGAFRLGGSTNRTRRNVRQFFGKMSVKEYKELQEITNDFSVIDKEMWK